MAVFSSLERPRLFRHSAGMTEPNKSAALNESGDGLTIIWVRGGFAPDASSDLAVADGVEFNRGADKSPLAFRERCERLAREMNATTLVFGGLPSGTWSNRA